MWNKVMEKGERERERERERIDGEANNITAADGHLT